MRYQHQKNMSGHSRCAGADVTRNVRRILIVLSGVPILLANCVVFSAGPATASAAAVQLIPTETKDSFDFETEQMQRTIRAVPHAASAGSNWRELAQKTKECRGGQQGRLTDPSSSVKSSRRAMPVH